MNIIEVKNIEGCLEGNNVRDIILDSPLTRDFIEELGKSGKLVYGKSDEKLVFAIIVRGKYTLKGMEAENSMRIFLPDKDSERFIEELRKQVALLE